MPQGRLDNSTIQDFTVKVKKIVNYLRFVIIRDGLLALLATEDGGPRIELCNIKFIGLFGFDTLSKGNQFHEKLVTYFTKLVYLLFIKV